MYLTIIVLAVVFFIAVVLNWHNLQYKSKRTGERTMVGDGVFNIIMSMMLFGGLGAMLIVGFTRVITTEEVPVDFPIYQVNGRYLSDGTSGEYNHQVTIYHYKNDDGLRKGWQESGSTAIRTIGADETAHAFMSCPDAATAWDWTVFPWEDLEPDCDNEFITFYIPSGQS